VAPEYFNDAPERPDVFGRMIACGCASEIARAAASNSASWSPSATSASGVPFIVSGIDQTTLRAGLSFFQMPGTQLSLEKSSQVVWP
jgi:hypothetical protein